MNIALLIFLIIFVLAFVIRIPIPVGFILATAVYLIFKGIDTGLVAEKLLTSLYSNYLLLAIPLFVFTAKVMNTGKITNNLFRFTKAVIGKLPGALGHVNVLASLIFSGMTGSAMADVSGLGLIEIEVMREENYDDGFSCAITAASSTIGPVFPPSIPMIQYALVSGASIGNLFLGGMIPGVIMSIALMIYIYFIAKKRDYPRGIKYTIKQFTSILIRAFPAILTPVILLSGIYSGLFSPTEAAAIAAIYSLIVSFVVYKCLGLNQLMNAIIDTIKTTGMIGLLIGSAYGLNFVIGMEHIPDIVAQFMLNITANKYVFLLMINILFLFFGMFINISTMILVFVPIVLPIVNILNIDLVHFGVIIVMNSMIGLITPPYGALLYIISGISGTKIISIIKELLPIICVLILVLLLCTYIPGIVTFMPNLFGL